MEAFICVRELKGALEQLAGSRPDEEETEERIENVCGIILDELKKQGLTDSDELFLERQKAEVLSRMEKLSGEKTQKEEKSSESDAAPSKEIRTLADEITAMEWQQFTQVKNQADGLPVRKILTLLTLCAKASFIPGSAGVGKLSGRFKRGQTIRLEPFDGKVCQDDGAYCAGGI